MKNCDLVLGPFQGMLAVVDIAVGTGVCGTAVAERKSQLVEDVHIHCNYIACDSAMNSELLVPITRSITLMLQLDLVTIFCCHPYFCSSYHFHFFCITI